MLRALKWIFATLFFLVLAAAGIAVGLHSWLASADFRDRASQQLSQALGVPATIGALSVDLWPLPAVAVDRLRIESRPPLLLERIEARPVWQSLLRGKPAVATLVVRNAVVPQDAIGAIVAAFDKAHPKKARPVPPEPVEGPASITLPQHLVLDKVTWVNAKGGRSVIDADARMEGDVLKVLVKIGGGTVKGTLREQVGSKGERLLTGQFDTAGVEVSNLTAPSRTLTGRLEAHTELRADIRQMPDALRSETKFTVRNAVLHGIDLAQAVRTVGISRGGDTRLDTLAGVVVTTGKAIQLNNLVASSGALSANGVVALSPDRRLSGHVTVSLLSAAAGGALGVPLAVGGTMDSPSVTLSRGALVGAALGTAIAPGLGTGAGASLGDKLGNGLKGLFGK